MYFIMIKFNIKIATPVFVFLRNLSIKTTCLKFDKIGNPENVLQLKDESIKKPRENEVLVKILAAPINPIDLSIIQGEHPLLPRVFPSVGGSDCVGEIVEIGPNVKKMKPGDRVIALTVGLGTWRTYGNYKVSGLLKISEKIGIAEAATISITACAAYRMLKDFVDLNPGELIIQNGANSSVGQYVHQLCRIWDMQCVGIIRCRKNACAVQSYLKSLGATEVFVDNKICETHFFHTYPLPRLGLNCIGGRHADEIANLLDTAGVLVTYGGMSGFPILLKHSFLIYKEISLKGFWIGSWKKRNFTSLENKKMIEEITELMACGLLKAPTHEFISLNDYKSVMDTSLTSIGFRDKKYIFTMNNSEQESK